MKSKKFRLGVRPPPPPLYKIHTFVFFFIDDLPYVLQLWYVLLAREAAIYVYLSVGEFQGALSKCLECFKVFQHLTFVLVATEQPQRIHTDQPQSSLLAVP